MKITILGGSGFVGSNVRPGFLIDHIVQNVDKLPNHDINFANSAIGDIAELETIWKVRNFNPDLIIVLAGQQYTSPHIPWKMRRDYFSGNVKIAHAVSANFAHGPSVPRIVYISTDMVYGLPMVDLINENTVTNPIGEYGRSKLEAEKIYLATFANVAILRPRLIVGPGRVGTIKTLAALIARGLPIPVIGDGENRYQMIGVGDLWSAIETIIVSGANGIYNIGSDASPTLNELFCEVKLKLNLDNRVIHINPRLAHGLLSVADKLNLSPLVYEQYALASNTCLLSNSKIKALGWIPEFGDTHLFTESLSHLLEN
jgi:dTDP-glucose 4,6-dehydratase